MFGRLEGSIPKDSRPKEGARPPWDVLLSETYKGLKIPLDFTPSLWYTKYRVRKEMRLYSYLS